MLDDLSVHSRTTANWNANYRLRKSFWNENSKQLYINNDHFSHSAINNSRLAFMAGDSNILEINFIEAQLDFDQPSIVSRIDLFSIIHAIDHLK